MLSARRAIDIVFIALVVVAILITAVIVSRALTDGFSVRLESEQQAQFENFGGQTGESGETDLTITNRDPAVAAESSTDQISAGIYESSHIVLPIAWGAVAGTLIWRGKVRSDWSRQGYDYDTFKLVTNMRGSPTRIRLLNAVNSSAKNKLQLAKELDVDWKTVDNHVEMLLQSRLVEERTVVGTARYYAITHDGAKVLSLLSASEMNGDKVDNN